MKSSIKISQKKHRTKEGQPNPRARARATRVLRRLRWLNCIVLTFNARQNFNAEAHPVKKKYICPVIIIIIRRTNTRSATPLQGAAGTRGVRDVPPCDAFRGWRGRSSGTFTSTRLRQAAQVQRHTQSFRLRQSVKSAKIRDAHSTHTHTLQKNAIDQQY